MKLFFCLLLTVCFLTISCEPVNQGQSPLPGQLEKVKLESLDAIPLSYGELEAVTTHAEYEGWAQLWFVDEQETIRMVRIQFHNNRIHDQVLVISRN